MGRSREAAGEGKGSALVRSSSSSSYQLSLPRSCSPSLPPSLTRSQQLIARLSPRLSCSLACALTLANQLTAADWQAARLLQPLLKRLSRPLLSCGRQSSPRKFPSCKFRKFHGNFPKLPWTVFPFLDTSAILSLPDGLIDSALLQVERDTSSGSCPA